MKNAAAVRTAHLLAAVLAGLTPASANALDLPEWAGDLRADVFGSLNYARSDSAERYNIDLDDDGTFREGSRVGLQLSLPLGERFTVETQLLAEAERRDITFSADWYFLKFAATPTLDLRAGRIRLPALLASDYTKVGIAYPWISPPIELYSAIGTTSLFGAEALWSVGFENVDLMVQSYIGGIKLNDVLVSAWRSDLDIDRSVGVSLSLESDWFRLHTGVSTGDIRLVYDEPSFVRGGTVDSDYRAWSVGAQIDWENTLVVAEVGGLTYPGDDLNDDVAGYVTVGHRFGDFTPHATFAKRRFVGTAPLFEPNQERLTLGLRYDVNDNIAFKSELSMIRPTGDSRGLFFLPPSDTTISTVQFALDFVF